MYRKCKSLRNIAAIPIILITSYDRGDRRSNCSTPYAAILESEFPHLFWVQGVASIK